MTLDLSPALLASVVAAGFGDPEERWLDYYNAVVDGPGSAALSIVTAFIDAVAEDDDALCWVGVNLVEPLVDLHWKSILQPLERALRASRPLRKALSCAWLDIRPRGRNRGSVVEERLYGLIPPEDQIGRRPRGAT